MTSSFTTNKKIEKPANGDFNNTWSVPINTDWDIIDRAFGGTTSLNAVAVSGTVALTVTQYQAPLVIISGALTGNINYQLPAGVGGYWFVFNNTSGSFSILFSSAGGGSTVTLAQGATTAVICDGTNVGRADTNPPVAGGSTTQVQYNNSGILAGSANFVFNGTQVGIGTATPAAVLDVVGNVRIATGSSFYWGDATSQITAVNAGPMRFLVGDAGEKMRIDASGNLGINTTPVIGYGNSIQLQQAGSGAVGALLSQSVGPDLQYLELLNNALPPAGAYTAGYNYTYSASAATKYTTRAGEHLWSNAPIGTAGATVPFVERFRIGTAGQFGLGGANYGTSGQALISQGASAAPIWGSLATGTVTSVGGTGTVNGITLTGTVTSSGNLTLGGTLSGVSLTTQVSGTLPIANGGTAATSAATALTSLGAYPAANPSGFTSNTGTVTSVSGTGSANGLSLSGTVTTTGSLTLGGSVTSVASAATIDGVTIGYRSIPRSTTSGTAVVGDVGKVIAVSAGITIPNATFAAGDAVSIYNDSAAAVTITQGASLTLRQGGTTNTGNRTLAARGMATVWFNSSSEAIVSGAGLT